MSNIFLRDLRQPRRKPARKNSVKLWILVAALFVAVSLLIYSGTAWTWFRPVVHKPLINHYAGLYKFDPLWVMAIIKVESGFSPTARSNKGAVGLMQLLPSTAQQLAPEIGLTVADDQALHDPAVNLHLGIYYLTKLQEMFPDDEIAVLAAYNAGPGITREWRKGKPALDLGDIPYPETRSFVRRVDQTYGALKILQGWKHLFGIRHER